VTRASMDSAFDNTLDDHRRWVPVVYLFLKEIIDLGLNDCLPWCKAIPTSVDEK
jgi:hypothetical protein